MTRVLIIYDVSFPFVKGGAQRRFYEVARRLAKQGANISWMTFQAWEGPAQIEAHGIRYIGIGRMPPIYDRTGKKRSKVEPLIFTFKLMFKMFQVRNYDTIWIGQWPILHLFPTIVFGKLFGVRVVVDWWEVWSKENWIGYANGIGRIGYVLQSWILRFVARHATIVTDSTLEKRRIERVIGRSASVRWIPNGVPTDEIGPVDIDAGTSFDIASLGRLKEHKRVDLLIHALWYLREKHDLAATAAIVGDGPERASLERMSQELGLSRQIRFFGHVADLRQTYSIMKSCKLCVVSTVNGGGGNLTLLEAYGCGLPVLAFKVEEGIDPELIVDEKTGLFVGMPSADLLAYALARLLRDQGRTREMKVCALAKSREYGWCATAEKYSLVLQGRAGATTNAATVLE